MVETSNDIVLNSLISVIVSIFEILGFYYIIFAMDSSGIFASLDLLSYGAVYLMPIVVIITSIYLIFKADILNI